MFIVDSNVIKINRGDAGTLNLVIPLSENENYEFDVGDKIQFRIFEKKGYDKDPVLEKEVEITEQCESVLISLSEEEKKKLLKKLVMILIYTNHILIISILNVQVVENK
mgnify:CR=1 FL=1